MKLLSIALLLAFYLCACMQHKDYQKQPSSDSDSLYEIGNSTSYQELHYPVTTQKSVPEDVLNAANKFTKFVNSEKVLQLSVPMGCDLRIEVADSMKESKGFLVIIRNTGGLVLASNVDELLNAYNELNKLAKSDKGRILMPTPCVITSFPTLKVKR